MVQLFALISSTGSVFVVAVLAQRIENKFSDFIQMKKKGRPRIGSNLVCLKPV